MKLDIELEVRQINLYLRYFATEIRIKKFCLTYFKLFKSYLKFAEIVGRLWVRSPFQIILIVLLDENSSSWCDFDGGKGDESSLRQPLYGLWNYNRVIQSFLFLCCPRSTQSMMYSIRFTVDSMARKVCQCLSISIKFQLTNQHRCS